jgi:alpha-glucosidase (family GH31 glycosyl hydrolase)
MAPQALAVIATLVSFAPHGNRIEMTLDRGSAEMVWLSPKSFHFMRTLDGPLPPGSWVDPVRETVALQIDDTPAALRMRSKFLDVSIQKRALLVNVHRIDGTPVMADLSEPRAEGALFEWERQAQPGVRFYGGPTGDPEFDLRGRSVDNSLPFLISTAGYGEYYFGLAGMHFDFTGAERYRVRVALVDYYFYYGPTPKEIFQEHKGLGERSLLPLTGPASWATLRKELLEAVHLAMCQASLPFFDLGAYSDAPEELKQRARQMGSLLSVVTPGSVGTTEFRKQLTSFFDIYDIEERDKGHPIWHALPYQFPDDPECAHHADEFMLGDEMLIAPIYQSGTKRQVYLPQGNWTNMETNEEFPGRRTITVDTRALPVFARNGAIVPLDSDGGIGLHYFPKLGGEFFLLEKDTGEYTQVHAAPAGDMMRLEIESKAERAYQWVVHHVERPTNVGFEDQKYSPVTAVASLADRTWFYDAAGKNLVVRVRVKAGEDNIVNLSWE